MQNKKALWSNPAQFAGVPGLGGTLQQPLSGLAGVQPFNMYGTQDLTYFPQDSKIYNQQMPLKIGSH